MSKEQLPKVSIKDIILIIKAIYEIKKLIKLLRKDKINRLKKQAQNNKK